MHSESRAAVLTPDLNADPESLGWQLGDSRTRSLVDQTSAVAQSPAQRTRSESPADLAASQSPARCAFVVALCLVQRMGSESLACQAAATALSPGPRKGSETLADRTATTALSLG